jgi:hypothetical protein
MLFHCCTVLHVISLLYRAACCFIVVPCCMLFHCCTVFHVVSLLYRDTCCFIVVPCCMLFHCSTVLHVLLISSLLFQLMHFTTLKTLKSHTKTLKICPYMFRSPLKPSSKGPWLYFAMLLNWNVDLHSLQRVSVCSCMSVYSVCVCVWVPIWRG